MDAPFETLMNVFWSCGFTEQQRRLVELDPRYQAMLKRGDADLAQKLACYLLDEAKGVEPRDHY